MSVHPSAPTLPHFDEKQDDLRKSVSTTDMPCGDVDENAEVVGEKPLTVMVKNVEVAEPLTVMEQIESIRRVEVDTASSGPSGTRWIIWDSILLLGSLLQAIVVPYRAAFDNADYAWDALTWAAFVLYLADMPWTMLAKWEFSKGKLVRDRDTLIWAYLQGWFCIDLLAAIGCVLPVQGRVLALVKLMRVDRYENVITAFEVYSGLSFGFITMCHMFTYMAGLGYVAHWVACVWIHILHQPGEASNRNDFFPDNDRSTYIAAFHTCMLLLVSLTNPKGFTEELPSLIGW